MRFEKTAIRSMLGLRFRDAATEQPVTEGLHVTVRRSDGVGSPTQAFRTASGAYAAQELAGLRGHERSSASVADRSVHYRVSVEDVRGRFVPVLLEVELPYTPDPAAQGMYPIIETPSDFDAETPESTCYLFSAVQRPVTVGQAAVYADLVERRAGQLRPAAHAVLEVRRVTNDDANGSSNGAVWYGLADADGRVTIQFPMPPVQLEELSSRPGGENSDGNGSGDGRRGNGGPRNGNGNGSPVPIGGRPLSARTWTLKVSVRYQPSALDVPDGADRPLLPSIFQQQPGTIYTDASTSEAEWSQTLSYGEPLVLKTDDLPGDRTALRIASHDNSS